jgi:hypothetical protein
VGEGVDFGQPRQNTRFDFGYEIKSEMEQVIGELRTPIFLCELRFVAAGSRPKNGGRSFVDGLC